MSTDEFPLLGIVTELREAIEAEDKTSSGSTRVRECMDNLRGRLDGMGCLLMETLIKAQEIDRGITLQ